MRTYLVATLVTLLICSQFGWAAPLPTGTLLTIDPGLVDFPQQPNNVLLSGSGIYVVQGTISGTNGTINSVAIAPGTDGGIVIGKSQSPAPGVDTATSTGNIDASFSFDGLSWWSDWTPNGTMNIFDDGSGINTVATSISSWDIQGNGIPSLRSLSETGNWVNLNVTQWQVTGDRYVLDFSAGLLRTIYGDWGGADFQVTDTVHWHLQGAIIQSVPLPPTAALLLSGAIGLLGAARSRVRKADLNS